MGLLFQKYTSDNCRLMRFRWIFHLSLQEGLWLVEFLEKKNYNVEYLPQTSTLKFCSGNNDEDWQFKRFINPLNVITLYVLAHCYASE